jgi:hypothetical protein
MKRKTSLVICPLIYLLARQQALAQCPQSCGDNWNTGFGVTISTGVENTVVGTQGLAFNQNGGQNTIVGAYAGYGIIGGGNTAIGDKTMNNNFAGDNNTALGYAALSYCGGNNNIGIGAVGGTKVTSGNDNIEIGNQGTADDDRVIRLGNIRTQRMTYIAGIAGVTVANGVGVIIDNDGHLGTMTSSARFKDAIKPMDKASEAILLLKPVTFRYKHELDPDGIPQFGLVAEQVEKVNPDLVARDDQGKAYTVRYEAVNAMLLNEHRKVAEQSNQLTKQDRKMQELETTIGQLKSTVARQKDLQATVAQQQHEIEALTASLKEQASQLHNVSDQFEMSKPAPQAVVQD